MIKIVARCIGNSSLQRIDLNYAAAQQIIAHYHQTIASSAAHPHDCLSLLIPHHGTHSLPHRMVLTDQVPFGREHASCSLHADTLTLHSVFVDFDSEYRVSFDVEGEKGTLAGDADSIDAGQGEAAFEEQEVACVFLEGY